jgi:RNA polymerase subunit RPABC4/transcription elongation factor Spt4
VDIGAASDADPADNVYEANFTVAVPNPDIFINLGGKEDYAPGDAIFVNGQVTQSTNGAPLSGLLVRVSLTDSGGFPLTTVFNVTTDDDGYFFAYITTPSGREGAQRVTATLITSEGNFTENENINIVAPFTPESIPTWVYLLIIIIVIVVIVIFSLYLYRVGLGRMVECGNCGALIPEASKHCPKCGVEFEADTAKCSECGAWIPSKAESCPECGAKFMTEPVEQGQGTGYIEAMRKQYDEYIDGFRTQAKMALGSKYSEEKFQEWLQTEPEYLPFEEWLRKEEMSKKTGVFPCPTCGTLNARDSKVCHRCGTVFDEKAAEETEAKPEEKKSPFRRVVKRSNDKDAPKEEQPAEQLPAESENKKE